MSLLEASKQNLTISSHFSQDYKIYVFTAWYINGKPNQKRLRDLLEKPEPMSDKYPQPSTLKTWIDNEFTAEAIFLDEQIAEELEKRLVSEKIEMLARHAEIAEKMQNEAWNWFESTQIVDEEGNKHLDLGNARTAITLLVEGLKIERESRGVAVISEKFAKMTDGELVDKLREFVTEVPEITTVEAMEVVDV